MAPVSVGVIAVRDVPAPLLHSMHFSSSIDPFCRFGHGLWRSVWSILSAVVLDFLLAGFAIATAGWCALCSHFHISFEPNKYVTFQSSYLSCEVPVVLHGASAFQNPRFSCRVPMLLPAGCCPTGF